MRDYLVLVPDGEPCRLDACPPGPFMAVRSGGGLGFKTEYGKMQADPGTKTGRGSDLRWSVTSEPDAYCLESGEAWCADDLVQPLVVRYINNTASLTIFD